MTLTNKMQELLRQADEVGELHDVSLATLQGLHNRGLIVWPDGHRRTATYTTMGGTFPTFSKVKLTDAGLAMARRLVLSQGITYS